MRKILATAGAIGLTATLILVAYRNYKASLYEGLSTGKIADIETNSLVMLFAGIGLTLAILVICWTIKQSRHDDYFPTSSLRPNPAIEAGYAISEPHNYLPPKPLALPPKVVTVPRLITNGTAQPYGFTIPAAPIHLRTTAQDEDTKTTIELTVALPALMRFIALATPSRTEWTGKRELYSDCAGFCNAQGLLDKQPNGGWKWKPQYPLESRKDWILQFDAPDAS